MLKYYIKTFGCAMNYSDSERIAGFLAKFCLKQASNINEADLIVFNTCGVRQMAEDRIYGQIHNIKVKSQPCLPAGRKSKVKIILTGCLANRKDVQRRLKNKVDLFFAIDDFKKLENWIIKNYLEIGNWKLEILKQKNIISKEKLAYLSVKPTYISKFKALVPIMTGCNNFCSYCVVPYARGREISRPADEILKEIKSLIKKGYKEIVLLGQNVNSYHKTCNIKHKTKFINFSDLLREINAIPGNFWISFISNHPKDFSDELIKTATKLEKVCEYIHLPIQAGNDEIIKKMNRKYTAAHYLSLVKKIKADFKKYKPGKLYSLTSDIIVGFPSETKKQFLCSAEIMEKVKFDMVYFGQYSPRPGTAAWKMKDNVSKKEKVRRERYLNEILKKTSFENNKKYIGKILDVLIDKELSPFKKGRAGEGFLSKSKTKIPLNPPFAKGEIIYFGRTRTMKNIKITTKDCHPELVSGSKTLVGKIIKVKITKANVWNLEGIA